MMETDKIVTAILEEAEDRLENVRASLVEDELTDYAHEIQDIIKLLELAVKRKDNKKRFKT